MEFKNSRVYVLIDNKSRITRIDGGYTISNITDPDNWILIDEGIGDRYNLCQSNYLDGGLYTDDGIYRWKLVDGKPVLRTDEEIQADREARPSPPPDEEDDLAAMLIDHEYRITLMELGVF